MQRANYTIIGSVFSATLAALLAWYALTMLAAEVALTMRALLAMAVFTFFVACGMGLVYAWQIGQSESRKRRAEAEQAEAKAEAEKRQIVTARHNDQVYVIEAGISKPLHLSPTNVNGSIIQPSAEEINRWLYFHAQRPAQQQPVIEVEPGCPHPLLLGAPPANTVELLAREQRLLLQGPSGSGKSSLLRHLVNYQVTQGTRVILCDPHGARPKWGTGVDAVGFGERYGEIMETFSQLEWLHKERLHQIEHGHPERAFEGVLVVIEEVQGLVEEMNHQKRDVGRYVRMFLTRTRKTAIDIWAVSQEGTVGALGLKGFARNREAFTVAETMGRDGRDHQVKITDNGEEIILPAPPLWPDTKPVGVEPRSIFDPPTAPSDDERAVIEYLRKNPGASNYAVCRDVFDDKRGESRYQMIDEIREGMEAFDYGS